MFQDKPLVFFMSFFLFVACGFVIYMGYRTYKDAEESAYMSCILSLKQDLIITIREDKIVREAIDIKHEWRTLNKNEVGMLFNSPSNTKSVDCGNYPTVQTYEDMQIAIRQIKGRIEMNVQINGRIEPTFIQEID